MNDNNESKINTNYNNKIQQFNHQLNNTQKSEKAKPPFDETNPNKIEKQNKERESSSESKRESSSVSKRENCGHDSTDEEE